MYDEIIKKIQYQIDRLSLAIEEERATNNRANIDQNYVTHLVGKINGLEISLAIVKAEEYHKRTA